MTAASAHRKTLAVIPLPSPGAEDVLVGDDGSVYTGTEDGSVFRIHPESHRVDRVAVTGGRPMGLESLPDGRILVCDATRGLLALDARSGGTEVLTGLVRGQRMLLCNNAAVASTGEIYFSDSSRVHPLERWRHDIAEDTRSGRLLRRNTDGTVDVLLEGLRFANGVALAADESYVLVAETAARTVVRRWLTGPREGTTDHLAADLPGYPDNIARGSDGLLWVAVASPKDPVVEGLMRSPMLLRRAALRLPQALQPSPKRTVRVIALADDGRVVHDHSLDASRFHMVTGVREHEGRVWLGSLVQPAIAVFDV